MTLQQLKYAVKVAEKGSINEAAKELYISQPSLSSAIMELEKEIQTTIFIRHNRGVSITSKGAEFLSYARQVLTQTDLLEAKFISGRHAKQHFCVSTQHYPFVSNAFVEFVSEFGQEEYDFALYETTTHEVIENVKTLFSEMGIIYLSNYNESVIRKILSESNLIFSELFCVRPHVFLWRHHPLAGKQIIELADLQEYPRISLSQGQNNAFYFSEEILSFKSVKKNIRVSDRAAVVNFMIGLNGYNFSSGVFPKYLHGDDIISLPLNVDEKMQVGTITHKDAVPTELGREFRRALEGYARRI
ncbi:LysR family transcriptional regulator [Emergencia timonensis]|uniref:LysR family transcriptional regulator n=1 Tax=Emergencia timonensis TaxID=1776384 RepID=UPI0008323E7A|nr:LysR family transcriptional regulator [Emergencia timonensis]WNX88310.1 LysR family transcriptional regulator [Emergencia timonensis]